LALLKLPIVTLLALLPLEAPAGGIDAADEIVIAQAVTTNVAPTKGRVSKSLFGPSTAPRGYGPQAFTWFWNEVSPARTAAHAERWSKIVGVIEIARRSGKPVFGSRAAVESILTDHRAILEREAKLRNVSIALLVAVIAVESGGNPGAISPKGAGGLMQLMPDTARRFGVSNALAPAQNIRGGAHYLDWLLRFFGDDAVLALAGYNAGEQAVERNLGVPPYSETRDYVAKVAGAYWVARQLCETPPKGPREVCALK
jgi:hypothetical protein